MKKKYFYIDFIRIIAAVLVILLHTTGLHLSQWSTVSHSIWMTENVYDSITRMSVPIFIMLSGALLLNKREAILEFYKKRLAKLLIPFVAWVVIYLLWRSLFLSEHLNLRTIAYNVIKGSVYYHIWYLYMLIGLYLITPFVRKITVNSTNKELIYLSALWLVFVSLIPTILYIARVRFNTPMEIGITIPFLVGHVGYFIIGTLINRISFSKIQIVSSWIGFVISCTVTIFGTLYFTHFSNSFDDIFYSYFSPSVAVEAICGFILLSHYGKILGDVISENIRGLMLKMGDASLGVYLIHPIFLDLLIKGKLLFPTNILNNYPIIGVPLAVIEIATISFVIVIILMKVPILNQIVGVSSKKVLVSREKVEEYNESL